MRRAFELEPGYSARIATPFAVVGVRTSGDLLTGLEYLPLGVATLEPIDAVSRGES